MNDAAIERRIGYLWITLPDAITMDNYVLIEQRIQASISEGIAERVVIDMKHIQNLYSSGIGLLVRMRKQVAEAGGFFCLVNISERCRMVLESTNLHSLIPMYATDVEFEISQHDVWSQRSYEEQIGFMYIVRLENNICRITITGRMTALQDKIARFATDVLQQQIKNYVFDMTGMDIIDSFGASQLESLLDMIRRKGGKSVAYGANEMIKELVSMLAIDRLIIFCENERKAIDAIG
jgi:anti-anti-sigma factor